MLLPCAPLCLHQLSTFVYWLFRCFQNVFCNSSSCHHVLLQEFIRRLLVKDPQQRLALDQVEQQPWIRENADPTVLARGPR